MNKKKMLVNFLLAAMIAAGLFVSPIQRQEASAAPPATVFRVKETVTLDPITRPPQTMCVGDKVPISFSYKTWTYSVMVGNGGTSARPGGVAGALYPDVVAGGTLSQSSWPLQRGIGSGVISATYTATKAGDGQIDIQANGVLEIEGNNTTGPFTIQECSKTLIIKASDITTVSDTDVDTNVYGKGGIKINTTPGSTRGTVTGGGAYYYKLQIRFRPLAPTIVCDKYVTLVNQQPFNVTGDAANDSIDIDIDFTPFDFPATKVNCKDTNGFSYSLQVTQPKHVDMNKDWDLGTLVFDKGVTAVGFSFGETGAGTVWLFTRKGSGK